MNSVLSKGYFSMTSLLSCRDVCIMLDKMERVNRQLLDIAGCASNNAPVPKDVAIIDQLTTVPQDQEQILSPESQRDSPCPPLSSLLDFAPLRP